MPNVSKSLSSFFLPSRPGAWNRTADTATMIAINDKMHKALAQVGGRIDAVFFCPHTAEDQCECRKPKPGMLKMIVERYDVDPKGTPAVGDSFTIVNNDPQNQVAADAADGTTFSDVVPGPVVVRSVQSGTGTAVAHFSMP